MRKFIPFALSLLSCMFDLNSDEFPYLVPKNFGLQLDWIALNHPVTTDSEGAQLLFNQGLTLLYAFNYDAAYWSFKRAAEADPEMAMAYWGMAFALGQNININITPDRERAAYDLIQKAITLYSQTSQSEKDYIDALSKRYTEAINPDLSRLAHDYSKAMKALMKKYPDDPDAAVLFVDSALDLNPWGQWTAQGDPLPGTEEIVEVLENVLKRRPDNLGANHYYIHAIEASRHPQRALMSADRLKKLLPTSGHILHMPSHIYMLVGEYHQAAQVNEEAVAVDRAYIREYGMQGNYPVHYLNHELNFLSRAYSMEGSFTNAKRASDELASLYAPHFKTMPELEYYASTPMFVLLRFHKWKDVLALPPFNSEMVITNVLRHFSRAISAAVLGDMDTAKLEQKYFLDGAEKLAPNVEYGYNKVSTIVQIADNVLSSKFAEVQHQTPEAIVFLKKAIAIQDSLNYNEPPDWFFPVRESLGSLLLRNGKYKEAEEVFRVDLRHSPRNGRALYGLWSSLVNQSKEIDAFWVKQEFDTAWKYSDTPLSVEEL